MLWNSPVEQCDIRTREEDNGRVVSVVDSFSRSRGRNVLVLGDDC